LRHALPIYARRLGCAMVGVLDADDDYRTTLASVPRNLRHNPDWLRATRNLANRVLSGEASAMLEVGCERFHFHAFPLHDFGLLVMGRAQPLEALFVRELVPVTQLFARTCGACRDYRHKLESEAELRHARDAALAAAQAKGAFVATISHEIRTPLNGIVGMADLLHDTPLNDEQREYLDAIRSSADHLVGVINDTLDFSRIEAQRLALERAPFNLPELARECVALTRVSAEAKGVRMELALPADIPRAVLGDALRLRQVLLNLMGNAVKFTERGVIRLSLALVEADDDSARVAFSVSDTGIGIAEDKLAHVFDAFTQADSSITRRYGGTGLGLAISSRLVGLMGGRLSARSTVGEGSVFRFALVLPLAAADAITTHSPSVVTSAAGALRILLAEDNAVNQALALRLLGKQGHRVHAVGNGRLALAAWERGDYDLILMDMMMPDMDGLEASRQIRAREAATGGHVPIIAMTANAMSGDRDRCLAAGMDGYVAKPVRAEILQREIARLTAGQAVEQAPEPALNGVFDRDEALSRIDGDEALLGALIELFAADAERHLGELDQALAAKDWAELTRGAHTLKGLLATFSARRAEQAASRLEQAARAAAGDTCASLAGILRAEVRRFLDVAAPARSDPQ